MPRQQLSKRFNRYYFNHKAIALKAFLFPDHRKFFSQLPCILALHLGKLIQGFYIFAGMGHGSDDHEGNQP
ncbi:MAG: hypothetical protein AAGD25_26785 [Cyanobacteria bacterium P01_F01_bin.150]